MNKLLLIILIASFLVFGFIASSRGFLKNGDVLSRSVCDQAINYSVGEIDLRFDLTQNQIKNYLSDAEAVWEEPSQKNLFQFDPEATLKVNFIFDKKQALNNQINQLEDQLKNSRGDLDSKKADLEIQAAEFQTKLNQFNQDVEYWNNRGGAPRDEYEKLIARQQELKTEAQSLNEQARQLNISADQFNLDVGRLNSQISEFNTDLAKRPEEGLYDSELNVIEIYFVPSNLELVHTLAHELGHSLGIGHTESDPESIMYPYSSESNKLTNADLEELNLVCQPKNISQVLINNASFLFDKYFNSTGNNNASF